MGSDYVKSGFCDTDIHSHPSDYKKYIQLITNGKQSVKSSWNGVWKNHEE